MRPRSLELALLVAVADCVYLAWRYLALHGAPDPWVVAHTGLCSWTAHIDCDQVLVTPEARAFFVPNATLGLGFFLGAAHWWFVGLRRYPEHRLHLARTLAVWLGVASVLTVRFWMLLVKLPALCPFCPWNHVFTYVAFLGALAAYRDARRAAPPLVSSSWKVLLPHVARSIAPLIVVNGIWGLLVALGVVDPGPTIVHFYN